MTPRAAPDRWREALVEALRREDVAVTGEVALAQFGSGATSTWALSCGSLRLFVKRADEDHRFLLDAEADALSALARAEAIRVPRVIARGRAADWQFLALEWLDLAPGGRDAALGRALARLHATTSPRFGWHCDNAIGPTLQVNAWNDDWAAFFRDHRLLPQLERAHANGYLEGSRREGERLLDQVAELLAGHNPRPSLVHGDLWSGNAACLRDGSPVIYDPAVYFGDRETDIAMTRLFGGFDASFHAAYSTQMPLPPGHELRCTLYNLYHVLNHLNIFGESYCPLAQRMLGSLLARG